MKSQEENATMQEWYREAIIEMVNKIDDERYLRRIYLFIDGFVEQGA